MTNFHIAIMVFGVFFFIGMYFTVEVKRFLKEKKELEEYYYKAFMRHKTNIDVK